jgi:hypothetical protein
VRAGRDDGIGPGLISIAWIGLAPRHGDPRQLVRRPSAPIGCRSMARSESEGWFQRGSNSCGSPRIGCKPTACRAQIAALP